MIPETSKRWQQVRPLSDRIVMWGASDQARVNTFILQEAGCSVFALIDDTPGMQSPFSSIPLFHGWDKFCSWLSNSPNLSAATTGFIIAIGNPYGHVRCKLHELMISAGFVSVSFADESALICKSVTFGSGLQVMPRVIVHNDVVIGKQCLLNTKALIEHDCILEDGVEVGPGAVLCGRVRVCAHSWIGAGATVLPRITIGPDSIVGAGSVVTTNVPTGVIVVGNPSKILKKNMFSSQ